MGYTRYWARPRELDAEQFRAFAEACRATCAELEGCLTDASFTADKICFKGRPGCETFLIERVASSSRREGLIFEFCKTQRLPYDAAVDQCLTILKARFPEVEIPEPA